MEGVMRWCLQKVSIRGLQGDFNILLKPFFICSSIVIPTTSAGGPDYFVSGPFGVEESSTRFFLPNIQYIEPTRTGKKAPPARGD
jgi:hypothetical protein